MAQEPSNLPQEVKEGPMSRGRWGPSPNPTTNPKLETQMRLRVLVGRDNRSFPSLEYWVASANAAGEISRFRNSMRLTRTRSRRPYIRWQPDRQKLKSVQTCSGRVPRILGRAKFRAVNLV